MTNMEQIEKYRRQIQETIQRQKSIISELERIEDRLAALTQKNYEQDAEIDLSLETIKSPDIYLEESIIVMPERLFNGIIRGFFIAFIIVILIIEVMMILKKS